MSDTLSTDDKPSRRHPHSKRPLTGERLGVKADVALALLETGATYATVQEATGISHPSIAALKKRKVNDRAHVEEIKRGLRSQCVLNANAVLNAMSRKKIREADLGSLARTAAILLDRSGIGPVSHVEVYKTTVNKYEKA